MRKSQEAISNGLPWNIPDSERPIYGFMAESGGRHNKMTAQYGDFRVVMNDDVRDRTTFTIGDSLGGHGIAAPLSGASAGRIALSAANENLGALITAVPSAAVGFVNRRQYFEAQIHGGLKASDIKTIHISEKQFAMGGISTKVAQELSKMGFKVFVDSPSRGSVAVDEFDVAKGVTVKLPAGVKPVLKHGNHDQSTHGHRGHSLASKYEQERRTRTVIQGQQMHRDWQVAAVYRAEAEVRPPFDVSTRPKAPRRADFPNAGEYLAAFNEYEYAHNKWVLEQTTNVVSLTGGRHLNGTKKGIQAYVDEVIKSDWFVERFGDGSNMPPLKLSVRKLSGNTAGQHTLSYSSRRGVKHELAIDKQFINSEDTLMHELAHYAMAISTFGVEGHGAEFAGGHLFIVEKIAGPVYADRLRAAYKKNGVRH
jgi:putative metallohydrolase (TIGR04338 family)